MAKGTANGASPGSWSVLCSLDNPQTVCLSSFLAATQSKNHNYNCIHPSKLTFSCLNYGSTAVETNRTAHMSQDGYSTDKNNSNTYKYEWIKLLHDKIHIKSRTNIERKQSPEQCPWSTHPEEPDSCLHWCWCNAGLAPRSKSCRNFLSTSESQDPYLKY